MKHGFFQKLLMISLSVILALTFLSGCDSRGGQGGNNQSSVVGDEDIKCIVGSDKAYIWGAPDTVSVVRDVSVLAQCSFWGEEWLDDADKLTCEGIKGDVEAFQVIITAKSAVSSFNVTVAGDLTRENGTEKIDSSNIEVFAERYIEVKKPSSASKSASMFSGWYPDALVPMAAYKARRENKIPKGNNQGVWVNVSIPEDAAAGVYKGALKVDLDGEKFDLPISVKVYNISMPSEVHAKTSFNIWYSEIDKGEEMMDDEGNIIDWSEIYYDYIVSKRLSPQTTEYLSLLSDTNNFTNYINDMIMIARNEKITTFRLPYYSKKNEELGLSVVKYETILGVLQAMAIKNIELVENGEDIDLFKKAFFYFGTIIDEPTTKNYAAVKYCDNAVTRAKNEAALLLVDYPELQKSLLNIPHIVTATVDCLEGNEYDGGGVQTWCTEAQRYKADVLANIKERKHSTDKYSIGEGFWIYMTMMTNNPYPSLQLDDNLLSPRTVFWMNSYYGIEGYLYWNVNYYSKFTTAQEERDIWNDPLSWSTANGDGYLVYPGSRYGLMTPISTLRLESLRQGSEDFEYIYMLENAIKKYNLSHEKSFDFEKIMLGFYDNVFKIGTTISQTNIKNFADARSRLLTLLEAVENETSDAKILLSEYEKTNN